MNGYSYLRYGFDGLKDTSLVVFLFLAGAIIIISRNVLVQLTSLYNLPPLREKDSVLLDGGRAVLEVERP